MQCKIIKQTVGKIEIADLPPAVIEIVRRHKGRVDIWWAYVENDHSEQLNAMEMFVQIVNPDADGDQEEDRKRSALFAELRAHQHFQEGHMTAWNEWFKYPTLYGFAPAKEWAEAMQERYPDCVRIVREECDTVYTDD